MSGSVRVLLLSWEYPPLVVGGLGRHVEALARELVTAGHDVHVVTRGDRSASHTERRAGVVVHRAALDPLAIDFTVESLLAWAQASEHTMLRAALAAVRDWQPDVLHAHDWLVAQTASTLVAMTGARLVCTLHATEAGRHQGWLPRPVNRAIDSLERWLAQQSAHVITCSGAMRADAVRMFELPPDRVSALPNGVHPARWRPSPAQRAAVRSRHAPEGPLLVYAGRLVHEKGVQTLLDAVTDLRRRHPTLRLAIAGEGPHDDTLRTQVRRLRLGRTVDWLGFVPETRLPALFGAADAVIVPSLYEPFGIVALEAAASGAPLVLADTGGLRDLADAGLAAATFPAGDAALLVTAIAEVLADPSRARQAAQRARRVVRRDFGWPAVAVRTAVLYGGAAAGGAAAGGAGGG